MVSLISGQRHFTLICKTQHAQPRRWKKRRTNKHGLGFAPSARREKFVIILCGFLWAIASEYPSEIPTQPPGTLTHPFALADMASESIGPNSSLNSRLSLTVTFRRLLLTAFFCSLPWDLAFPRLLPVSQETSRASPLCGVSRQNRQRDPLNGTHPHSQKRMPPIVPHFLFFLFFFPFLLSLFLIRYISWWFYLFYIIALHNDVIFFKNMNADLMIERRMFFLCIYNFIHCFCIILNTHRWSLNTLYHNF